MDVLKDKQKLGKSHVSNFSCSIIAYIKFGSNFIQAVNMDEIQFRKLFEGTGVQVRRENIFHVFVPNGPYIATIYADTKRIEFDEDFMDPTNHGPDLRPLLEYIEKEGYKTNMK